jgi:sarcosine/dimethylglycine N-methyltransferase
MSEGYSEVVKTAESYYDSPDADNFYATVWGGEDIHIGMYAYDGEPVFDASRRTVARMAELAGLTGNERVLDIGAGYGGSARYIAATYGCSVVALNLSKVENERDRRMNKEQGLDHLIDVVDASFESLPYEDASFDVVWSQDAILHSGERDRVLAEVARVLRPGGTFVFTDPMQTDDCPAGVLDPILARIHLDTLGSPGFYRQTNGALGLREEVFEEHAAQLPNHYGSILRELEQRDASGALDGLVSPDYRDRMRSGLRHWVEGGRNGYLTWGVFIFRKPAD